MIQEEKIQRVAKRYIKYYMISVYLSSSASMDWPRPNKYLDSRGYDNVVEYMIKKYNELLEYNELQIDNFNNIYKQVGYSETVEILGKEIVEDKLLRGL
jgi:hypothetical protein